MDCKGPKYRQMHRTSGHENAPLPHRKGAESNSLDLQDFPCQRSSIAEQRFHSKVAVLLLLAVAALLVIVAASPLWAEKQESLDQWLADLKTEALAQGISPKTLDRAFRDFRPIARVIELDASQPEYTLTLEQYLGRVVRKSRVVRGRDKLTRYASLLENVYQRYGVQSRFLVSLWGIETEFGRVTGKFPVIQAIATLAYDSRRSSYFRRELIQALRIADEGHVPLGKMRGSWAGAMGQLQFMPSAFHDFGVDFNQDGRVDIWNDLEDAFASAANYLSRSGWSRGHTWGREVKLPPSLDTAMLGLETQKSLSEWQSLGVRRAGGEDLPKNPDLLASILQPDGKKGRAFAVYDNFRAILAWNKSDYFGIAVGSLADQIVER